MIEKRLWTSLSVFFLFSLRFIFIFIPRFNFLISRQEARPAKENSKLNKRKFHFLSFLSEKRKKRIVEKYFLFSFFLYFFPFTFSHHRHLRLRHQAQAPCSAAKSSPSASSRTPSCLRRSRTCHPCTWSRRPRHGRWCVFLFVCFLVHEKSVSDVAVEVTLKKKEK